MGYAHRDAALFCTITPESGVQMKVVLQLYRTMRENPTGTRYLNCQILKRLKCHVNIGERCLRVGMCMPVNCIFILSRNWLSQYYVIGYEVVWEKPMPGGGMFGYVKAYIAGIEEQTKKSLDGGYCDITPSFDFLTLFC